MREVWLRSQQHAHGVQPILLPELPASYDGPVTASTGLGLSLCRGLAHSCGGWLALDQGQEDGFTHLWCVVDVSLPPPTDMRPSASTASRSGTGLSEPTFAPQASQPGVSRQLISVHIGSSNPFTSERDDVYVSNRWGSRILCNTTSTFLIVALMFVSHCRSSCESARVHPALGLESKPDDTGHFSPTLSMVREFSHASAVTTDADAAPTPSGGVANGVISMPLPSTSEDPGFSGSSEREVHTTRVSQSEVRIGNPPLAAEAGAATVPLSGHRAPSHNAIDWSTIVVAFVDDERANQTIGKQYLRKIGVLPSNIIALRDGAWM